MENGKALARVDEEIKLPLEIKPDTKPKAMIDGIIELLPLAGTVELNEEQKAILYASVDESGVEIRPDGLIYLPWMEYVTRLRQAFGMSWAHIPQGSPVIKDNQVLWGFWLIIQGKPYSFSIGGQEYHPNNYSMTYADALEGAKSNALMRNCKSLGISLELWKPSFIKAWKVKYAETYLDDKGKTKWRKKGGSTPKVNPEPPKKETTKAFDWLDRMKKAKTLLGKDKYYEILTGRYEHTHANEVTDPDEQESLLQDLTLAYKDKKAGE